MSFIQILAIIACLMSIVSKWFFVHRLSTLNKLLAIEKKSYAVARKEWQLTSRAYQQAVAKEKQLEGECKLLKRNLTKINLIYNEAVEKEIKDKKKVEDQRRELETLG